MNNMAKNWKSILFYILIPVLLIGAVWYLSSNQSGTEVQYSQVVQMFEENQIKDFSLDLSSAALLITTRRVLPATGSPVCCRRLLCSLLLWVLGSMRSGG